MMTLGEKIVLLRKARGISQEQLAERLGVSRQAVSKWELNEAIPDVPRVVALSELFGVTTDYLLKSGSEEDGEAPTAAGAAAGPAPAGEKIDRKWLGMAIVIACALGLLCMWAVTEIKDTNYLINGKYWAAGLSGYLAFHGWARVVFLGMILCLIGGVRLLMGKPFLLTILTRAFWKEQFEDWGAAPSGGPVSGEGNVSPRGEEECPQAGDRPKNDTDKEI